MSEEKFSFEHSARYSLEERLAFWNTVLAEVDGEQAKAVLPDAVTELNNLMQETDIPVGESCVFSGDGSWQQPALEEVPTENSVDPHIDDDQIRHGRITAQEGILRGLMPYTFEDEVYEIRYGFETSKEGIAETPYRATVHTYHMYVKPETANIVALHTFEDDAQPDDSEHDLLRKTDQAYALGHYSNKMAQLVRSTRFRRTRRRDQFDQVNNIIHAAETESSVRGQEVTLFPEFAYDLRFSSSEPDLHLVYLNNLAISGICLSLSMPTPKDIRDKAIRRDTDLIDPYDGLSLCLSLDESAENLPDYLELEEGDILHVPLSSQEVEFMISPATSVNEIMSEDNEEET